VLRNGERPRVYAPRIMLNSMDTSCG
jgi:hypothetical protein